MSRYSLSHLSDPALLRDLAATLARDRTSTADLIAHIAEFDGRKLYLPAAYPSTHAWCVGELHLCEQAAFKRILAARTARRFPAIFAALAQGRLHLSAVVLLAPYLTQDSADGLLAAATHKSKSGIERLLAERFPKSDMLAWVEPIPSASLVRSEQSDAESDACQLSPGIVQTETVPAARGDRSSAKPLSAQSFAVQFTLSRRGHDQLRYAQELLGHQIPSGDIAQVFERALDALIPQLEKHKFAATARPRTGARRPTRSARHIPADIKRAVWERDSGQCTFVSETGHRCEARARLEFDHIEEIARCGEATVAGIRLRCRAHNQYGAECTFGAEFMRHKRIAAAVARVAAKQRAEAARAYEALAAQPHVLEVVPWLRHLGFNDREARNAAALCREMSGAALEERVRVALSHFRPRGTRTVRAGGCPDPVASRACAGAVGAGH